MDLTEIGKKHEKNVEAWLTHPEDGFLMTRIPDQMTGFYKVSRNIADYYLYKCPNLYYIECKATYEDRFDFSMLTQDQHDGMLEASKVNGVHGYVIVLFQTYKRSFIIDINDIKKLEDSGKKSLNIKKIAKWNIPYVEIETIPNNRKGILEYQYEQAQDIFK